MDRTHAWPSVPALPPIASVLTFQFSVVSTIKTGAVITRCNRGDESLPCVYLQLKTMMEMTLPLCLGC